jgi:hypothetical protein
MNRRSTFVPIFVAILCGWIATTVAQVQRMLGTIVESAPVTIVPEPGRTPLATLSEGTQVQLLGPEENGWYRITFQDNYLLGDRVGYVRAEHIRTSSIPALPANGSSDDSADRKGSRTGASRSSAPRRDGLTDSSIAEAIIIGQQRGVAGLRLLDNGQRWKTNPGTNTSRLRLQIYTPLAWIQQNAADAAAAARPFTMGDVTDEMTQPVMRILVYAESTGYGTPAPSLRQVVLRGADTDVVVSPNSKAPFSEHVLSAAGSSSVFEGMRMTFPMEAVRRLRGPHGDNEVVIASIGAHGAGKIVRITREHLQDLPM